MDLFTQAVCFMVVATPVPATGQRALVLGGYDNVDVANRVRAELLGYTEDIGKQIKDRRYRQSPEGIRAAEQARQAQLKEDADRRAGKLPDTSVISVTGVIGTLSTTSYGYIPFWQKVSVVEAPKKECP